MSTTVALLCATSKPATSLTATSSNSGGGGALTLLCPRTGSIFSTWRATATAGGNSWLGVESAQTFPFGNLVLGYGGTSTATARSNRKDDTYGMLLSIRTPLSSPPLLHWKCRLPEAQLSAGILLSKCGTFAVAGAASGRLFVWCLHQEGRLLRSFQAHFRAVTAMAWSDGDSLLMTGGADGMCHVYSMMDLVSEDGDLGEDQDVMEPIRTWSVHHLPVTALLALHGRGDRMASVSEDGQLIVMEVFSSLTLFKMQFDGGLTSLACDDSDNNRLFVGSKQGSIYCIDLNVYSMQQTAQVGISTTASIVKRRKVEATLSQEDQVFGSGGHEVDDDDNAPTSYKSELRGHDATITSLACLTDADGSEWLVSGDEEGVLRIWDIPSRSCIRIIQPWSSNVVRTTTTDSSSASTSKASSKHPVTAIIVIPRHDEEQLSSLLSPFDTAYSTSKSNNNRLVSLISPLQRFTDAMNGKRHQQQSDAMVPVPFLRSGGDDVEAQLTDMDIGFSNRAAGTPIPVAASTTSLETANSAERRARSTVVVGDPEECNSKEVQKQEELEIDQLKRELEEANSKIARWEDVNNKLMAKLESSGKV